MLLKRQSQRILDIMTLLGGVVLLAALSFEILHGDHNRFSTGYMVTQFIVCVIFLFDFFIHMTYADKKHRFLLSNIAFLLLSIPYLNIMEWSGLSLPRNVTVLIGIVPMLRAFMALYIVIRWLVNNRIEQLLTTYILTLGMFTYLSALMFFDYERGINVGLTGFSDALWWAGMNVTTVGANIYAVTSVGRILSVMLPLMGMMMLPVFTAYIVQQYNRKNGGRG